MFQMKRIFSFLLSVLMVAALFGCSFLEEKQPKEETPETKWVETYPEPTLTEFADYDNLDYGEYLTIPDYTQFTVTKKVKEVTEEDLALEIEDLLATFNTNSGAEYYKHLFEDENGNALVLKEQDHVFFDCDCFVGGTELPSGCLRWADIDLKDGNGYIEGFYNPFIGKAVGETFSFKLAFPEDYIDSAKDPDRASLLNGKEADWTITIKYVAGDKEDPTELTEALVQEFFNAESTAAFLADYRKILEEEADNDAKLDAMEAVWNMTMDGTSVKKFPENSVEYYIQYIMNELAKIADTNGQTIQAVLKSNDFKDEDDVREYAKDWVKEKMLTSALLKAEDLKPSEGYEDWLYKTASTMGTNVDTFVNYYNYYYGPNYLYEVYTIELLNTRLLERANVETEIVRGETTN